MKKISSVFIVLAFVIGVVSAFSPTITHSIAHAWSANWKCTYCSAVTTTSNCEPYPGQCWRNNNGPHNWVVTRRY